MEVLFSFVLKICSKECTSKYKFFFNVLCGNWKAQMHENTVLGDKKGLKVETNTIFENCRRLLYMSFYLHLLWNCVLKNLHRNMNVLIWNGPPQINDLWNWFSLDLGVQMRWYLDWGSFRAWKTFSKIFVNKTPVVLTKYWYWGPCR